MDIELNKQALKSILIEKMGDKRAQTAFEIILRFDVYLVENAISEVSLFEVTSPIYVEGIMVRLKGDRRIRDDFNGKLFFIERGLVHYKSYLTNKKDAWRDSAFEENDESGEILEELETTCNHDEYEAKKISKMLDDPEAFIKELARKGK